MAFDERVTLWLQCTLPLPYACMFAALYACGIAYKLYMNLTHRMQDTHAHKAGNGRVEGKKLLSRWRQLDFIVLWLLWSEFFLVSFLNLSSIDPSFQMWVSTFNRGMHVHWWVSLRLVSTQKFWKIESAVTLLTIMYVKIIHS